MRSPPWGYRSLCVRALCFLPLHGGLPWLSRPAFLCVRACAPPAHWAISKQLCLPGCICSAFRRRASMRSPGARHLRNLGRLCVNSVRPRHPSPLHCCARAHHLPSPLLSSFPLHPSFFYRIWAILSFSISHKATVFSRASCGRALARSPWPPRQQNIASAPPPKRFRKTFSRYSLHQQKQTH